MTLNITVLTPTRIFQSSDFRITSGGALIDDQTMKLVTLHYPSFDGLVSYTGIATTAGDSRDTAERVTFWLAGKPNLRFHEVVEEIRLGASEFVRAAQAQEGALRRLTLIAAAFVESRPTVAVISNFESVNASDPDTIQPELRTSWDALRPGERPKVILTGAKSAVPQADRGHLVALAEEAGEDSARIRNGIRSINGAAYRRRPDGTISKAAQSFRLTQAAPVCRISRILQGYVFGQSTMAIVGIC
jgi:hypothetical protein